MSACCNEYPNCKCVESTHGDAENLRRIQLAEFKLAIAKTPRKPQNNICYHGKKIKNCKHCMKHIHDLHNGKASLKEVQHKVLPNKQS